MTAMTQLLPIILSSVSTRMPVKNIYDGKAGQELREKISVKKYLNIPSKVFRSTSSNPVRLPIVLVSANLEEGYIIGRVAASSTEMAFFWEGKKNKKNQR